MRAALVFKDIWQTETETVSFKSYKFLNSFLARFFNLLYKFRSFGRVKDPKTQLQNYVNWLEWSEWREPSIL
jgi:hypothetical protein